MARDLDKIPTIDELRIALEKCGYSIRPYDMVLLNNYLESITVGDQGNANIVKYLNVSELPTVGDDDTLYVITNNSLLYVWDNGAYLPISGGGGGGGTVTTWGDIIGNILNQQDLATAFNNKVDKVAGKQLSSEDFTGIEKSKLSGIEQGAQVNPSASQIKAYYESNANTNAFTDLEKSKLASMESGHFRGQYTSLSALNVAVPTGEIGDYAFVDLGVGQDVGTYIWDSNDTKWVIQQGQSSAMTPSQIKSGYESNADTNAYTDAEKNKLASAITSETDPTVPSWAKQSTKPTYTKGEVGLSNVDNIQQATKSEFVSHDSDSVRHITSAERNAWNASAGAGLNLGETSTTAYRGDRGAIAYNHSQSTHAPIDAQKNSDITKAEIEAKLTGTVTTHTHSTAQISDFPEQGNLIAGTNITITESGNDITISAAGGGGGSSVHNDLTGRNTADAHPISAITGLQIIADSVSNATTLVAGTNVTLTPNGNDLVISATGGGGGGSTYINVEEEVTLVGGDISGNMINITLTQTPAIAERFDVFLNGLLVPRSLLNITGTSLSIDLTTLNMLPVIGDFLCIKYYR